MQDPDLLKVQKIMRIDPKAWVIKKRKTATAVIAGLDNGKILTSKKMAAFPSVVSFPFSPFRMENG